MKPAAAGASAGGPSPRSSRAWSAITAGPGAVPSSSRSIWRSSSNARSASAGLPDASWTSISSRCADSRNGASPIAVRAACSAASSSRPPIRSPASPSAFERAQAQALDLAAAVAHPRPVALGQERLGAECERGAGLGGGVLPAAVVERLDRDLDGVGERLGVHPQRLRQREPELSAARQRVRPERAAQLRQQRGERGI